MSSKAAQHQTSTRSDLNTEDDDLLNVPPTIVTSYLQSINSSPEIIRRLIEQGSSQKYRRGKLRQRWSGGNFTENGLY